MLEGEAGPAGVTAQAPASATTGAIIAQGASGEPSDATQLAAKAMTGCAWNATVSHVVTVYSLAARCFKFVIF